jgi:hypothetical protein
LAGFEVIIYALLSDRQGIEGLNEAELLEYAREELPSGLEVRSIQKSRKSIGRSLIALIFRL